MSLPVWTFGKQQMETSNHSTSNALSKRARCEAKICTSIKRRASTLEHTSTKEAAAVPYVVICAATTPPHLPTTIVQFPASHEKEITQGSVAHASTKPRAVVTMEFFTSLLLFFSPPTFF